MIGKSSEHGRDPSSNLGRGVYPKVYKVYLCIHKHMETNIRLNVDIKKRLDLMKVHSRESYNDVITRIIGNMKKNIDEESLKETIEVLSDPEIMRDIAEALEDYERGRFIELK